MRNEKDVFKELPKEELLSAGIDPTEKGRSATFVQVDNRPSLSRSLFEGVELMPIEEALNRYPKYRDYLGRAFSMVGKDFPEDTEGGFFLLVKKGHTIVLPIQVCLFLKKRQFSQRIHNIIVVEESASAYVINGCTSEKAATDAFHLGISEYFVEKGGYLNFTMIHSWNEGVAVRPKSVAIVEEGGTFISNYVCLKPVKEVVMYPTCLLRGEGARASFSSIILSHSGSLQDIGSRVILSAPNTSAEIVSRTVSMGGKIIARGHLYASSPGVKAHLECQGLIVSEKGTIHAIPELETDYRDVDLSHEAAIGKISKEEIEYLASRGIDEDLARSLIIRGFMDTDILGLPEELRKKIDELKDQLTENSM